MGLSYTNASSYYGSSGDHGNYRYLTFLELVNGFNAAYVGHGKICEHVDARDVNYHALRALQELSYDTIRSKKDWEVIIPSTLVLVMPHDYVNYIKLSWIDEGGLKHIIYPTRFTGNPSQSQQQIADHGGFSSAATYDETSTTRANFEARQVDPNTGSHNTDKDVYDALLGTRYGLTPEHAQTNGSFYIDEDAGKFHFSSNMAGKTVMLEYISDGMYADSGNLEPNTALIPKLAEEAIIKWILYGILLAKADTPAGLLAQIKKERFAETRKAKIRLSNFKSEEIAQIMRNSTKIIKH